MSSHRPLTLSDLPVEILYYITHNFSLSTLFRLLRVSRLFYVVFCDEVYRLAATSPAAHIYLYRCASPTHDNTNAARRFIHYCADKTVISVSVSRKILRYGSALQVAAKNGHVAMVQLLLDHGADVNARGGFYGTALHSAARNGNLAVIRLLLDHGAKINIRCGEYGYVLQAAAAKGNEKIVRLLLDCGAKINARGGFYGTALQAVVACNSNEAVVKLLLDRGANINIRGGIYRTSAVKWEHNKRVIQLLVDHGPKSTSSVANTAAPL